MKKEDRSELPLHGKAATRDDDREKKRQRLADLIGKLLARHWLKSIAQDQEQPDSRSVDRE